MKSLDITRTLGTIVIPLRAKQVGEFIKNGHRKISPTRIGSGSGVTLWLCDSVTLWLCDSVTLWLCDSVTLSLCDSVVIKWSNNSAAFHPFGPKFFCVHLGKKLCLKNFFFLNRGPVGKKNSDLSHYLSHLTRYRSEIWNLGSKLQNKIKIFYKKISADGRKWLCPFWPVLGFCIKMTQTYFTF